MTFGLIVPETGFIYNIFEAHFFPDIDGNFSQTFYENLSVMLAMSIADQADFLFRLIDSGGPQKNDGVKKDNTVSHDVFCSDDGLFRDGREQKNNFVMGVIKNTQTKVDAYLSPMTRFSKSCSS